jgi:hydrogenase expression/formation protein HypC
MCLGVPGKVTSIRDDRGTKMATVDFGGVTKEICLAYVPEARIGDYTIIHAGFAITLLDEASALETLTLMREVGLLDDEFGLDASMLAQVDTGPPSAPDADPSPGGPL